ncbi:unnamed protein product, partial [Tetraodon nigroviridis]
GGAGGQPGRDGSEVLGRDGAAAGCHRQDGGPPVAAAAGHAAHQDRLRPPAAHQAEPGDGDRHLQAPAGGGGDSQGSSPTKKLSTEGFSICLFLVVCAEEPDVRTRKIVKVVTQTMVDGKVVDESSEVEQIEET